MSKPKAQVRKAKYVPQEYRDPTRDYQKEAETLMWTDENGKPISRIDLINYDTSNRTIFEPTPNSQFNQPQVNHYDKAFINQEKRKQKAIQERQATRDAVSSALDFVPIIGDIKGGYEGILQPLQQGNYLTAGIGAGMMLLPNIIEKPLKLVGKGVRNIILNVATNRKISNESLKKARRMSYYDNIFTLDDVDGTDINLIDVPISGESYFRAETRRSPEKDFLKYDDDESYFISYGLPWVEHQHAPVIYEFPLNTLGHLPASNSKGMIREGTNVVLLGRNALRENSFQRTGIVNDPIYEKYFGHSRFGNIDRLTINGRYDNNPEYFKLHQGNQTVISGNKLKDILQNSEYKIWQRDENGNLYYKIFTPYYNDAKKLSYGTEILNILGK